MVKPPRDATATILTRRRLAFRLAAVVLALAVFPGIPELVVRLAAPPLDGFRLIYFQDDPNTPRLFVNDPVLGWKARPSADVKFLGNRVRIGADGFRMATAAANIAAAATRTVLCLGDSTTFGWKMPDDGHYSALLQTQLNRAGAATSEPQPETWRVLNAGVPGYSSEQVRRQADQLLARVRPNWVVVCVGNNDGWPATQADGRALPPPGSLRPRLVELLSYSQFAVWVKDRVGGEPSRAFAQPALDRAVPRVSLDEFCDNLRAIVARCQAHGARVVLLAPPVNVYHSPVRGDQLPGYDRVVTDSRQVAELMSAGQYDAGLKLVDTLCVEHADDHRYVWLKGATLSKLGQVEAGREWLEAALERDPFPEGCKRSYRRAVEQLAADEDLDFLDVNRLFSAETAPQTPERLYLDWCHPVAEGHRLIAEALARILRQRPQP